MTYRFVQGIDYGTRKGTLGFAIHMAEGGDGTVGWLARRTGESLSAWKTRVRGVSANFVVLSTGEIVQMVGWANASGSMNPSDQSDSAGFYRQAIIEQVLGDLEANPNAYSLSVEITGFRAQGPNAKQVAAVIELVAEARRKFPLMRGAYGHADQTATKGCPGTAPGMLTIWNTIGHGLFLPDTGTGDDMVELFSMPESDGPYPGTVDANTPVYSSATDTTPRTTLNQPGKPFMVVGAASGNVKATTGRRWLYGQYEGVPVALGCVDVSRINR